MTVKTSVFDHPLYTFSPFGPNNFFSLEPVFFPQHKKFKCIYLYKIKDKITGVLVQFLDTSSTHA
jgi:hypothetical protein